MSVRKREVDGAATASQEGRPSGLWPTRGMSNTPCGTSMIPRVHRYSRQCVNNPGRTPNSAAPKSAPRPTHPPRSFAPAFSLSSIHTAMRPRRPPRLQRPGPCTSRRTSMRRQARFSPAGATPGEIVHLCAQPTLPASAYAFGITFPDSQRQGRIDGPLDVSARCQAPIRHPCVSKGEVPQASLGIGRHRKHPKAPLTPPGSHKRIRCAQTVTYNHPVVMTRKIRGVTRANS